MAYNAKHGPSPKIDSSTEPHKSYHTLEPPDHRTPTTTMTAPTPNSTPNKITTISCLDHVLPDKDIAEILDMNLGKEETPVINMMNKYTSQNIISGLTKSNSKTGLAPNTDTVPTNIALIKSVESIIPTNIDPFHRPILAPNGRINIENIQEMQ